MWLVTLSSDINANILKSILSSLHPLTSASLLENEFYKNFNLDHPQKFITFERKGIFQWQVLISSFVAVRGTDPLPEAKYIFRENRLASQLCLIFNCLSFQNSKIFSNFAPPVS